jgi:hypothetical protein
VSRPATAPNPGPVPGGTRPLRPRSAGTRPERNPHHPPASRGAGARCTQGAPERKTGSILAPPFEALLRREAFERRRRTWTHLSAGIRPRSVHAVEFSKTVAPLLGGESSSGARPGP